MQNERRTIRVLGIDLGVATGVARVVWDGTQALNPLAKKVDPLYDFELLAPDVRGAAMWDYYQQWIDKELKYAWQEEGVIYDLVVMEGLAFHGSNVVDQARLATLVELRCYQLDIPLLLVPSTRHKKWAYGNNKDKHSDAKQEVRSRAERHWGSHRITNDHLADAGFCAEIGLLYLSAPYLSTAYVYQDEVLRDLWKERDAAAAALAEVQQVADDKLRREQQRQEARRIRDAEAAARQQRQAERKQNAQNKRDAAQAKREAKQAKPAKGNSQLTAALTSLLEM